MPRLPHQVPSKVHASAKVRGCVVCSATTLLRRRFWRCEQFLDLGVEHLEGQGADDEDALERVALRAVGQDAARALDSGCSVRCEAGRGQARCQSADRPDRALQRLGPRIGPTDTHGNRTRPHRALSRWATRQTRDLRDAWRVCRPAALQTARDVTARAGMASDSNHCASPRGNHPTRPNVRRFLGDPNHRLRVRAPTRDGCRSEVLVAVPLSSLAGRLLGAPAVAGCSGRIVTSTVTRSLPRTNASR